MAKIANHQSSQTTKMLLIGAQGSGKTGALCSLADAGYNVRVLDLDNGLDLVKNLLTDPKSRYSTEAADRFDYETLTDKMRQMGGILVPAKATVWQRSMGLLQNWKTETADYGPVASWTPKEVLVIDSLSFLSRAALQFVLSMNARLGQQPHQSDWYQGQQLLDSLLQMLYDENIRCNVIVNCHIMFIGEEGGPQKGYPESLGKALSPKIGSYFNTIVQAKTTGQGTNEKRKIVTNSNGGIELKNTAPLRVKAEYPIETGLAELFRDLRGEVPK